MRVARLPACTYRIPVTTVSTTAAQSTVFAIHWWSAVSGRSANPTATSCTTVFTLAQCVAGTASPRRPQKLRNTLIVISRAAMIATGSHQNSPAATRAIMAPRTSTLSASGSRNAPERVAPCRRAR